VCRYSLRHRVNRYALPGTLVRLPPGRVNAHHAGYGWHCNPAVPERSPTAGYRSDVDDPPIPGLQHNCRQHRTGNVKQVLRFQVELALPLAENGSLVGTNSGKGVITPVWVHARIVASDIDTAESAPSAHAGPHSSHLISS